MDSSSAPEIAMVNLPGQTGEQAAPSTLSPHPSSPANFMQPSQPLPTPQLAFDQSNAYLNQYHWPAAAGTTTQYLSAPSYSPKDVKFSIHEADEEPWR